MENTASITAKMAAFGRAFYAENAANPVFTDAKGKELIGEEEYRAMEAWIRQGVDFFLPGKNQADETTMLREIVYSQIAPLPVSRGKFCEDSLRTAMHTGTEQYVLLGAGLDTFAFRERSWGRNCEVFEVDHPCTQEDKRRRIQAAGWQIPPNWHEVPVDFSARDSAEHLIEKLREAGFDRGKKTFFSWLGVSYYLSPGEIGRMLRALVALSAEGSSLVFDCAGEGFFSSPVQRVQNMIAMASAGGEPMKTAFRYEELEKLLEAHGFLIYEWLTPRDIHARYFSGPGEEMTAFEHVHFVLAVKK